MNVAEQSLARIAETLGRIEGRLEGVLAEMQRLAKVEIEHGDRIGRLERSFARAAGMAAVVSAIVAAIVRFLMG